jgi:sulfate/thiosulfate transport system substrate-binding protein
VILRQKLGALGALALLVPGLVLAAGCGGDDEASAGTGGGGDSTLTLVAYSTPREVYEELIPAFQATPEGEGVEFEQSYAASGEQRRAVEDGLPADVVALSLEPDVTALEEKGLVPAGWQDDDPYNGMVSDSVVVLAVREGNPKGIRGWDDLIEDGVEVITPNPFTSGGAQWNVMAAYGAQIAQGRSKEQALAYLDALFAHVPVQNKSAREALQTFSAGKGDVLIAYENEAILAKAEGEPIDYVIPDQTLLIENPIAPTAAAPPAAQAFVDFALSPESQRAFGAKGYRPVVEEVHAEFDYAEPETLLTIDGDLGGWPAVKAEFFDPEDGAVARIFRGQGIATE